MAHLVPLWLLPVLAMLLAGLFAGFAAGLFGIGGGFVVVPALLIVLLRRAFPLRPVLTAVMIGLASAAASASLLEICHAYDAAATDLLTHALAVAIVVAVNAAMGGRLLSKA